MLVINHIEPVGLIAENGSDLAKAFCNLYFVQAVNEIADQNDIEAIHFMGSVAGQSLSFMFQKVSIDQLDSILEQIKSHVITSAGVVEAQEQSHSAKPCHSQHNHPIKEIAG